MPPTTATTAASAIPVPEIQADEPVAVIAIASVAPLDGPPDAERINTFTLAPKKNDSPLEGFTTRVVADLRARVLRKPLTSAAAAFSAGLVMARLFR